MLLFLAMLAAGCQATCEQACTNLLGCEVQGTERVSQAECEESCNEQKDLYAKWTDTQLRDGFDDELDCVADSTCDDIAAGVCYQDGVWSF